MTDRVFVFEFINALWPPSRRLAFGVRAGPGEGYGCWTRREAQLRTRLFSLAVSGRRGAPPWRQTPNSERQTPNVSVTLSALDPLP
jgi:hypothetical protein